MSLRACFVFVSVSVSVSFVYVFQNKGLDVQAVCSSDL